MSPYYKRIFVIVLDSLGIGNAADAALFGDEGADTLGHIAERMERFRIPCLQSLGLANLKSLSGVRPAARPRGRYCALNEKSRGKDTMTGHWEMAGIYTEKALVTFADSGFPPELIRELERRAGREVIGNRSASGTEILDELGEREIKENKLIVYTSADSVLQICGSEEHMGLETLYRFCEIARELTLREEWRVGRVIARPYTGERRGEFRRTSNRKDYSLRPPGPTALDALQTAGFDVLGIGKIYDIFSGSGIGRSLHSDSSAHGMDQTIACCREEDFTGLCFVNLVDFDALWGHRRDPVGYGRELERFDEKLRVLTEELRRDDLLILSADHGTDPTWKGTDHTREQAPFLAYSPRFGSGSGGAVAEAGSFAVIGATVCDNFGVKMPEGTIGRSKLDELK